MAKKKIIHQPQFSKVPRTQKRRNEIYERILQDGLWSINKLQTGKHYNVSHRVICDDIKAILEHIPKEEKTQAQINIQLTNQKALTACLKILNDPKTDTTDKIRAAKAITTMNQQYTKFLEDYGIKEKIADKHEHSHDLASELQQAIKEIDQEMHDDRKQQE